MGFERETVDTDGMVHHTFTEDFYAYIANDVNDWFDTSNYSPSIPRPLLIGRNKKVVELMKDEIGGAIITDFAALMSKTYVYRLLDGFQGKKCKGIRHSA